MYVSLTMPMFNYLIVLSSVKMSVTFSFLTGSFETCK